MPVILAPPGSTPDVRLAAIEKALKQVSTIADGALQIPPNMRGGSPGQAIAGGKPLFDAQGLIQVMNLLGSQFHTNQVIAGAQPVGTEFVLDTTTFTLARTTTVYIIAGSGSSYIANSGGPYLPFENVYVKVDGAIPSLQVQGSLTAYQGAAIVNPTNAYSFLAPSLSQGSHTVQLIWAAANGVGDTYNGGTDGILVFGMGS